MRIKKPFHSIRFRMYVFLALLFAGVALLMLFNNVAVVNIMRAEVCRTAQDLLSVSSQRLDDTLSAASSYLAAIAYQNLEIEAIERKTLDTTEFHVSMERIKRQFNNSAYASSVDSFFYFDPAKPLYFANINDIFNPVRAALLEGKLSLSEQSAGKWSVLRSGGDDFLIRAIRVGRSYVGAWVGVSSALSHIKSDQLTGSMVFLLDDAGNFLTPEAPDIRLDPETIGPAGEYTFAQIEGARWLAVTQGVRFGDFCLVALIPDASISSRLNNLSLVIVIACAIAFVIFAFGVALLNHWIVRPVRDLTAAIRALQGGDFTATLPQNTYDEFEAVNQAFNAASEEIKTLKIGMYEERLHKQKIQMQYLQLQIAPHFLINCLNTIYQLTDTKQYELTHIMLRTLSQHLRYTLSSGETVSLREELLHVENYLQLSAIRYPDSIVLAREDDPAAQDALAIPLLILGFVENTVKYEATIGKCLEIHIETSLTHREDGPWVRLRIWDTGGGFSPGILHDLQDIRGYVEKYGDRHIGISNVFQRAEILFDGSVFSFSNRPGAGAQIDILFPYLPYEKGVFSDESADC